MLQDMFIGSVAHGNGGAIKARLRTDLLMGRFVHLQDMPVQYFQNLLLVIHNLSTMTT
jgi:hypothetical protein